MKLRRCDLGEHLKNECEHRNVKCDYCKNDVAFASIKVKTDKLRIYNITATTIITQVIIY